MKSKTVAFYDVYHKQNNKTNHLIGRDNITYWHIIRLLEKAEPHLTNKKVLDIGCGVGTLPFYLAQRGAVVLGVDVSERAIALAQYTQIQTQTSSVKFRQTALSGTNDVRAPKYEIPNDFDVILCTEVIEHVEDDQALLKSCFSKLKKGGKMVLTTQRNDGFLAKIGFFAGHDERVGHFRRYQPQQLIALFEKAGFKVNFTQDADGLLRSILYTTRLSFLLRFIRGPLIPLFQWLDLQSIRLFGAADIQVIALKK